MQEQSMSVIVPSPLLYTVQCTCMYAGLKRPSSLLLMMPSSSPTTFLIYIAPLHHYLDPPTRNIPTPPPCPLYAPCLDGLTLDPPTGLVLGETLFLNHIYNFLYYICTVLSTNLSYDLYFLRVKCIMLQVRNPCIFTAPIRCRVQI